MLYINYIIIGAGGGGGSKQDGIHSQGPMPPHRGEEEGGGEEEKVSLLTHTTARGMGRKWHIMMGWGVQKGPKLHNIIKVQHLATTILKTIWHICTYFQIQSQIFINVPKKDYVGFFLTTNIYKYWFFNID